MNSICIIKQPAGLGDILFCLKIAVKVLEQKKAEKVIWPVSDVYSYIGEYIDIKGLEFVNENDEFEGKDLYLSDQKSVTYDNDNMMINLQRADEVIKGVGVMYCKYNMINLKYQNWIDYVDIKRNYQREQKLESVLNLTKDSPDYHLVNRVFATYPNLLQAESVPTFKEKFNTIEVKNMNFDRIFDWLGVIERSKSFHTVETAFCYLAALCNKEEVVVYNRNCKTDFSYVKQIYPSNWQYI